MFSNISRPSAVDVLRPFVVGDTFYADTTTTLAKRAIGATNDILIVTGGVPTWSSTVVLTSLSVIDSGFSIIGSADATKRLMFEVDAQTANDTLTINTGAQTDSRTLSVPVLAGSDTIATLGVANAFLLSTNADFIQSVRNSSAGTSARAILKALNDGSIPLEYGVTSSGFTPVGVLGINQPHIATNAANGLLVEAASTKFSVSYVTKATVDTNGLTVIAAATQDAMRLAGRAGGSSSYIGTLTPTTLTASRTWTFPDAALIVAGSASSLTSGRVPFVTTGGLLIDSAKLLYSDTLPTFTLGAGASNSPFLIMNKGNTGGQVNYLKFQAEGADNVIVRTSGNNTGADAGGNFGIDAYTDASAFIDTPFGFTRVAGGLVTLGSAARVVSFPGTTSASSAIAGAVTIGNGVAATSVALGGGNINAGGKIRASSASGPECLRVDSVDESSTIASNGAYFLGGVGVTKCLSLGTDASGIAIYWTANTAYRCRTSVATDKMYIDVPQVIFRDQSNAFAGQMSLSNGLLVLDNTTGKTLTVLSTTDATAIATASAIYSGGVVITKNLIHNQGRGAGITSTATAAGTTTLTNASDEIQTFIGSTTQIIQFPAANLFGAGIAVLYTINNQSSGTVTPTRAGADTFQGGGTTDPVLAGASQNYASNGASVWLKV